MNENPLLTICVTTYNNEKTIEKTLRSILNQSYPNFEIVVSDNGSSDKTIEIVNSFKSPKISVRSNIKKIKSDKWYIGGYDNYNGCLESGMIKGEFVAFYHSDDIYEKDIAEKEVSFLVNNPGAGAVFSMGKMINEKDETTGKHKIPKELRDKDVYNFTDIFKNILKYGNTFLLTPTFMARTNIFSKIGLFSEEKFETSADLEMWLRILENYDIGILKDNLINRRTNGLSVSYNSLRTREADYFKAMDYFIKKESPNLNIENKLLRQYAYQKDTDNTLRAMNFLIKNEIESAQKTIQPLSINTLQAFFENINLLRIKILGLKIVILLCINMGLGKYLGKLLRLVLHF
jgi:glycosyltransferase involved in cell wall biosynthesis